MTRPPKRPRDTNQLAKAIVDIASGEEPDVREGPATANAQRRGGLAGGRARALKLTESQRSEIARVAAEARWKKS